MTTNTNTKNTFKIGQTFKKEYPVEAAVWCNANGAHIELVEGKYTIVKNEPMPEPTTEEKVQALENETGLTRAVRELVLADGSGASDYVRAKAQEIEALANPLRGGPEVSAPAEPQTEEVL